MQVWSVVSQKGGAGKTTIAIHLSIALAGMGYRVRVLDVDPQQSAARWSNVRDADEPEFTVVIAPTLNSELSVCRASKVDYVILDTSPRADRDCVTVARASDLILVPVRPTVLDVPAVLDTIQLLETANLLDRAVAIINAAAPKTSEASHAAATIEQMGIALCPHRLQELVDFRKSLLKGKGVTEHDPKSQAAKEITGLAKWLLNISEQRATRMEAANE